MRRPRRQARHLAPVAEAGMVGLAFGNSPAAMPGAGGRRPIFGTNPVAAVFARRHSPAIVVDLSLSEVARGKLMVAAREGKPIPPGWAVNRDGNPVRLPGARREQLMAQAQARGVEVSSALLEQLQALAAASPDSSGAPGPAASPGPAKPRPATPGPPA